MKGSIVYFGRESETEFPGRPTATAGNTLFPRASTRYIRARHDSGQTFQQNQSCHAKTTVGEPGILSDCEFVFQAALIIIKLSQATISASKPALRPHTWAGPGGNQQPGGGDGEPRPAHRSGKPDNNNNATTTKGVQGTGYGCYGGFGAAEGRRPQPQVSINITQSGGQCADMPRGDAARKPTRILGISWNGGRSPRHVTSLSLFFSLLSAAVRPLNNAQDGILTVSYARKFNAPKRETRLAGAG